MNQIIAVALAIVLAASAAGAAPGGTLVLVRLEREADAYALLDRGFAVVAARPAFALVWMREGETLALRGYPTVDLGFPPATVYLAWARAGAGALGGPGVSVLAVVEETYVIAASPPAAERLAMRGAELKRVDMTPIKAPRRVELPAVTYNPLVAAAVARVRADRYFGFVEDLAAFRTRYSHADEMVAAADYIEDAFADAGWATARPTYVYEPMDNDYLFDVTFRPGGRLGWLPSVWGYVWRTDDYGQTWRAYKSEGKPSEVAFTSDDVGFAVGGKGYLARTEDGGRTWRELPLADPDAYLDDVWFYDAARGVAVGEGGAIYRTTDGGASWSRATSPTNKSLLGVYAESASRWWALGGEATALRSDDGGASWYAVDIPAAGGLTLRRIAFADAAHATIVGYDGTVLYSDDGGASWTRVSGTYPEWPYFTDVAYADATRGWAVGSDGKVFRTDDAGAHWTPQSQPLGAGVTFEGLKVLGPNEAWAAGYPSAVIHTTDGGATWQAVHITNTAPIVWENVEATKAGVTRPDELYLLCGHFDDISDDPWNDAPGAEDNASGVAALLEAAAVLSDCRFDATVKLVAFSGEEEGLLGSKAYALEAHEADADIRGVFNMDMISYLDEPVHDVEVRYNDFSQELLAYYRDAARLYVPGYVIHAATSGQGGSDHESFWDYGYPALLSIEYPGKQFYPWYHTTEDVPAHLTPAYGADVLRTNLAAAASLAGPREGPAPTSHDVLAYPNPARVGRGHDHIRFGNLAPGAALAVFDLAGREIWKGRAGPAGAVEWPLKTSDGDAVASGVYVYVAEDPGGTRSFGKVAVLR